MAAKRRKLTHLERLLVWQMTDGLCAICDQPIPFDSGWHADHTIPWVVTHRSLLQDFQPTCALCNLRKGRRYGEKDIPRISG